MKYINKMKKIAIIIIIICTYSPIGAQVFQSKGDQKVIGRMMIAPSGVTSDNTYNGNLVIAKPNASGQYINFVKQTGTPWSIGTAYGTNNFAIGLSMANDAAFTAPFINISNGGMVGIGTNPTAKLDVAALNGEGIRIGKINDIGSLSVPLGGLTSKYNIDFTGFRDICPDQIGARISALRFNNHVANSALVQKTGLAFYTNPTGTNSGTTDLLERMRITPEGRVGIGTNDPDQALTVKGKIHTNEVIIDMLYPIADYVFHPSYNLMPLHEVEQYVITNSHLPEIPSAAEVSKNGLSLGEMQNKLLQKIEELTLYVIEQDKKIERLEKGQR